MLVITLLMLLSSEEATETFAYLDLPTDEALILIDDCVTARRLYAGKHQAHAETLRATPDPDQMWMKLAELAIHIGASDKHDREAIRTMSVALGARIRRYEYEQQSTSRRGDKACACCPLSGEGCGSSHLCCVCREVPASSAWRPCAALSSASPSAWPQ